MQILIFSTLGYQPTIEAWKIPRPEISAFIKNTGQSIHNSVPRSGQIYRLEKKLTGQR